MTTIRVVDALPGAGKTSAAINMINEDMDEFGDSANNYVYITPYLDEVDRIKQSTHRKFYSPTFQTVKGETFTKFDSFHALLADGKCIASTHALFQRANDETRELIQNGNYVLILDEVMDVIEQLEVKKNDIDLLFENGLISVDDDGFITWNKDKMNYETRYDDIRDMALNHTLIYYRDTILVWAFPADIFRAFKQVYILTYRFSGQIQAYYYDLFNVSYEMWHAEIVNGRYSFVPGPADESHTRAKLQQLINIYDGKLNDIGDADYSLSSTWYDKRSALVIRQLKNNISNYLRNIVKSKSSDAMWTTFIKHRNKLKGEGFARAFVPCTARATNDYRDRSNVVYAVNRYVNPIVYGFFHDKGITVDQDEYFLAEMIQWLFRSAIRDGKPINLYIPSKRARTLLVNWLSDHTR
ncbi:hypothetical protein [Alicyclobacillus acidoterrestris]|uniref:Uncharacterized protein n=1 Tax=Alicyclobacillus acidoterrestris (strain ATCC 49025 / DSM 3922 / CIP 106132 / NCIMB 13137 / GD3B) TaxID=1356854 RepID=T0BUB6_ALIAG|nr:hypothetical protein [Alicyclobacillus acidoterrestris]EPZ47683.1 hypothetical protein N007_05360 [Alicyclobacillus acidoterrestris ATCC 49025]UNO47998.1 hypothetical protein K1I37_15090 [Alicyclobacillus acidoterrestris]